MKLLSVWGFLFLLVACGKENSPPTPPAPVKTDPVKQVSEKEKNDKLNEYVKEFKDLKYQVVCLGDQKAKNPVLFILKTNFTPPKDAKKITDYHGMLFHFGVKEGKFDLLFGSPYNIVKSDRTELDPTGGSAKAYTTWSFLLHVSESNPLNNARVVFDKADERKEGVTFKGVFSQSPLLKEVKSIELDCPVFDLK